MDTIRFDCDRRYLIKTPRCQINSDTESSSVDCPTEVSVTDNSMKHEPASSCDDDGGHINRAASLYDLSTFLEADTSCWSFSVPSMDMNDLDLSLTSSSFQADASTIDAIYRTQQGQNHPEDKWKTPMPAWDLSNSALSSDNDALEVDKSSRVVAAASEIATYLVPEKISKLLQ